MGTMSMPTRRNLMELLLNTIHLKIEEADWLPDYAASRCLRCEKKFTFRRRRHHCRHCGHIFCSRCASSSTTIRKLGIRTKVRVCDMCIVVLRNNKRGSVELTLSPPKSQTAAYKYASSPATTPAHYDASDESKFTPETTRSYHVAVSEPTFPPSSIESKSTPAMESTHAAAVASTNFSPVDTTPTTRQHHDAATASTTFSPFEKL